MQDAMYRKNLLLIILGLFIGISGCNADSRPLPPMNSVSVLPGNNKPVPLETATVSFLDDYRQGLETAKREAKLVLVFFTLPNSAASQRMMETTFRDEEIKRLSNRFICIQIDGSGESEFCKSMDIKGFPTVLFMNSQGEELQRLAGKLTPDQLALQMHVMIQTTAIKIGAVIRK
jgi:thioredoxin-related protein